MNSSISQKIVGVSQRIDHIASRSEFRDALDQRVVHWLAQAGFVAVAVPNVLADVNVSASEPTLVSWLQAIQPDGLILSGGSDIGEYPERDATERYLLSWAKERRKPVLGICRGLQMTAVWGGVDLVTVAGHAGTRHDLEASSRESDWPANVNSFHNWSIASCPDGFEIVARAKDGAIEAIRHSELPWEGWMWHPEREVPFSPVDTQRLRVLFNSVAEG